MVMLPGSTLFLAVCAQRDLWPSGAWPIVDAEAARTVTELFALAAVLGIREGGVCCRHARATVARPSDVFAPPHCLAGTAGVASAPGCIPASPVVVGEPGAAPAPALDRAHAYYVASGCAAAVDADPVGGLVFDHLTAGVRDAVVFGAGVEHAIARAVDALLRRHVRTHVVLDAAAPADAAEAQRVIAQWKRRGVDGATAATIARLLEHGAGP